MGRTWVQRLADEPRIPNVQGFKFVANSPETSETHHFLKSILLRPAYLPGCCDALPTRDMRYFHAYEAYCSAPRGDSDWPALRIGPASPGPFERGWKTFMQSQHKPARAAERTYLTDENDQFNTPSIWNTREVKEATDNLDDCEAEDGFDDCEDAGNVRRRHYRQIIPERVASHPTVSEYCAFVTERFARNFEGIAQAGVSKPLREIDEGVKIPERPVFRTMPIKGMQVSLMLKLPKCEHGKASTCSVRTPLSSITSILSCSPRS